MTKPILTLNYFYSLEDTLTQDLWDKFERFNLPIEIEEVVEVTSINPDTSEPFEVEYEFSNSSLITWYLKAFKGIPEEDKYDFVLTFLRNLKQLQNCFYKAILTPDFQRFINDETSEWLAAERDAAEENRADVIQEERRLNQ